MLLSLSSLLTSLSLLTSSLPLPLPWSLQFRMLLLLTSLRFCAFQRSQRPAVSPRTDAGMGTGKPC